MSNVKYANFPLFIKTQFRLSVQEDVYNIFDGKYKVSLLVKDGFKGLRELQEEDELDLILEIRSEIRKSLSRV